jgi:hypothetical protein
MFQQGMVAYPPAGYAMNIPPGSFAPYTPMLNAQSAPMAYPNAMPGFAPMMQPPPQAIPGARGGYPSYSNQYPGKHMGGGRGGGRGPRSNPASPQGSGSGHGRFGNSNGYRKNQGESDVGFDGNGGRGTGGYRGPYPMSMMDNAAMQQPFIYPGVYMNGQFINGYAMDPMMQQQLQQQQQQLQHLQQQQAMPQPSRVQQSSGDFYAAGSNSDQENDRGRDFIYYAGRTTQKSMQSASVDQADGMLHAADANASSLSQLKSVSMDGAISDTTSPDDQSSGQRDPAKMTSSSYSHRPRENRGASSSSASSSNPQENPGSLKVNAYEDRSNPRKYSSSGPMSQGPNSPGGRSSRGGGGAGGSGVSQSGPAPASGDHGRRGQHRNGGGGSSNRRNENDGGNRGAGNAYRSRSDHHKPPPTFNLEADFPTLVSLPLVSLYCGRPSLMCE